MKSETGNDSRPTFSGLMHDTLNHVSTVMSIAQFGLISKEMSPELQGDMKRIVEVMRQVSDNLNRLAELAPEE